MTRTTSIVDAQINAVVDQAATILKYDNELFDTLARKSKEKVQHDIRFNRVLLKKRTCYVFDDFWITRSKEGLQNDPVYYVMMPGDHAILFQFGFGLMRTYIRNGLLLESTEGDILLAHSMRLIGIRGRTKAEFQSFIQGRIPERLRTMKLKSILKTYYLIGYIQSEDIVNQIRNFTRLVHTFKYPELEG